MGSLAAAHDGFDHVGMYVSDVDAAFSRFTRLGFQVTPPGRFADQPLVTACVMFPDTYLSISGVHDWSSAPDWMRAGMGYGLEAFVLRSNDIDATAARIRAAGGALTIEGEHRVQRWLDLPGGRDTLEFRVVRLSRGALPAIERTNICQHVTPHLLWRPELTRHANGASGLRALIAIHDQPAAAAAIYARIFGAAAIRQEAECLTVACGRIELRLMTAQGFAWRYPGTTVPAEKRLPGLVAAVVEVADLAWTRGFLCHYGVPVQCGGNGSLVVAPHDACGGGIEFVSAG